MSTIAGNKALVDAGAEEFSHLGFFGPNLDHVKTNIGDSLLGTGSLKSVIVAGTISLFGKSAEQNAQTNVLLTVTLKIAKHSKTIFNAYNSPSHSRLEGNDRGLCHYLHLSFR